jgi:GT2 family glycosyltransferase
MTLRALEREPIRSGPTVTPDVSIVIPTHNRCGLLEKVLDRLATQTIDVAAMEVIVVADGCSDDTEEMLRSQNRPFDLRVVAQEQRGAGASRNAGARVARAPIVIFIDDDIMAAPDLVEQHLRAHREEGTTVTIGRLAPDPSPKVPGWWRWLEWQVEKQYRMMQAGQRPIDGRRLYSGNFSVEREAFLQVGGFDETLRHSEDVELGLRLEQNDATFGLAVAASGEHCGYTSYRAWLDMAYRYGRWDGALAVNPEYASPWEATFGAYRRRSRWLRLCAKRVLDHPGTFKTLMRLLRSGGVIAGALRLRALERSFYAGIYDLTYWQGVCDEWGGASVLWRTLGRMR